MEEKEAIEAQIKFQSEFLQILRSRKPKSYFFLLLEMKFVCFSSVDRPSCKTSCDFEVLSKESHCELHRFAQGGEPLSNNRGDQGWLPVLILSLKESDKQTRRPAVVFLHSTNSHKESLRPLLEAYASRGYIAISVDSRYHGERAKDINTYCDFVALAQFELTINFDSETVYYSLTWQECMHVARDDLGKDAIDKEVVEKVWDRIATRSSSQFDSPCSIPSIAPRRLLILNGAEDPRCPLAGLEIPRAKASKAYEAFHRTDDFQ
ncbi:esterase/lipase domain protein, putative, partial [Medicago truncatula]